MQALYRTTFILALGLAFIVPAAYAESPPDTNVAELSHGYAILYQTVKKITKLNKVLYVKLESDPLDAWIRH